jgi:hypothetical protein
MPKHLRAATIAAASLAALAVAAPAASAATAPDLYVATANKGKLARTDTPGVYKLTMAQPGPSVTTFTDHPARQASAISTRQFVHDWAQAGFRADPPNAALVIGNAPATRDVYTFELSKPRITKGDSVVFRAKRIGPPSSGPLELYSKRADKPTPHKFGNASLFVDSGSAPQTPVHVQVSGLSQGQVVDLQFNQTVDLSKMTTNVRTTNGAGTAIDNGSLLVQAQGSALSNGFFDIAVDGTAASGTASIPAGASVSIAVGNGPAQPIANGAFNVG